jgi:hypothetical protein
MNLYEFIGYSVAAPRVGAADRHKAGRYDPVSNNVTMFKTDGTPMGNPPCEFEQHEPFVSTTGDRNNYKCASEKLTQAPAQQPAAE